MWWWEWEMDVWCGCARVGWERDGMGWLISEKWLGSPVWAVADQDSTFCDERIVGRCWILNAMMFVRSDVWMKWVVWCWEGKGRWGELMWCGSGCSRGWSNQWIETYSDPRSSISVQILNLCSYQFGKAKSSCERLSRDESSRGVVDRWRKYGVKPIVIQVTVTQAMWLAKYATVNQTSKAISDDVIKQPTSSTEGLQQVYSTSRLWVTDR